MGFWTDLGRVGTAIGTMGGSEVYRGIKDNKNPLEIAANVGTAGLYGNYQDTKDRKAAEDAANIAKKNAATYGSNVEAGQEMIGQLYGRSAQDVGERATTYADKLRENLSKDYSGADVQRQESSLALAQKRAAMGLKGGGAASELESTRRNAAIRSNLINQDYQDKALALYGENVGATQRGVAGIDSTYRGLANASQQSPIPRASGFLGSIICTELHNQGLISFDEWLRTSAYGRKLNNNTYTGYLILAKPIVKLMKKSSMFSRLWIGWGKSLAKQRPNLFTKVMMPICYVVGYVRKIKEEKVIRIVKA